MRHFVRGEIVEHVGRREDQAPRERQRARRGAGTPAARLVADRQPLDPDAERLGIGLRGLLQIACALRASGSRARGARCARRRRRRRECVRRCRAFPSTPCRARRRDARSGAATPRNGTTVPGRNGAAFGKRPRRAAIQAPWRCANSFASAMRAARRHGQDRFAIARMNSQACSGARGDVAAAGSNRFASHA